MCHFPIFFLNDICTSNLFLCVFKHSTSTVDQSLWNVDLNWNQYQVITNRLGVSSDAADITQV